MSVPALGQQGLQNGLGRLLVQAVLGGRGRRAEGLVEEGHADALGAADVPQRGRGPRLPLDHLGEQRQPHRDHLAVLGEPRRPTAPGTLAASGVSSDDFSGKTP